MTKLLATPSAERDSERRAARAGGAASAVRPSPILLAWAVAGVLLVLPAGVPPVDRTQEARVLETAREMLGAGVGGWMSPHLNGALRLQKPPLAYWMAAVSYKLFGVSEWAGRAPFASVGWLSLGLTYVFARDLFGRRAALLSAAAMLGSMLFARHASLAETDILVLAFVQAAAYAFWRAWALPRGEDARHARVLWLHAGFLSIGLTAIAKGMPFAFPLLLFVVLVVFGRRWDLLRSAVLTGAPLAAIGVAAPWYAYMLHLHGADKFLFEMRAAAAGAGHRSSFLTYIPDLAVALAPWTVLTVTAVATAFRRRFRRDRRVLLLLLWAGAVLVPLCVVGQKQKHYLMPAIPPLMILTGWFVDRLIRLAGTRGDDGARPARVLLPVTAALCVAGAAAVPVAARVIRGNIAWYDVAAATAIAGCAGAAAWVALRRRVEHAAVVLACCAAVAVPLVMTLWEASLSPIKPPDIARAARATFGGNRSYCFYRGPALGIGFALREVVPVTRSADELAPLIARDRRLVLITRQPSDAPPVEPPAGFERRLSFTTDAGMVSFSELVDPDRALAAASIAAKDTAAGKRGEGDE
jgi:4-amino-4-deoxy-L-arabinose transferase-like glycosyltransferase